MTLVDFSPPEKKIQLPQMKHTTKYRQTSIPGKATPPYARIAVYITAFQSSPVNIYNTVVACLCLQKINPFAYNNDYCH